MKIYTKTGDRGETGLWGGARVPKDHARVAAYGDVDELNCAVGAAIAALPKAAAGLVPQLTRVQEELFVLGSILAGYETVFPSASIERLEKEIDAMTSELPEMTSFILPGGAAGAPLHVARAVCRRAERLVVALAQSEKLPPELVIYLNRLSDHLFTAARWANARAGCRETPWAGLAKGK